MKEVAKKCKDPRKDSGQRNISYTRYSKNCFTQIYRDLHEDAMLVPLRAKATVTKPRTVLKRKSFQVLLYIMRVGLIVLVTSFEN